MNATLLMLMVVLPFIEGKHNVTCSTPRIEARPGDVVPLQCATDPPVNLEDYTLDYKRVDVDPNLVVYCRRHGNHRPELQAPQYRNTTVFDPKDLRRGIFVLRMRVQQSDSGQYKCSIPKISFSFIFTINVTERQQEVTERNDGFNTTRLNETTPSVTADGNNMTLILSIATPTIIIIIIIIIISVGVLVKPGKFKECLERCRGTAKPAAEMENNTELQHLRDPNGAAAQG